MKCNFFPLSNIPRGKEFERATRSRSRGAEKGGQVRKVQISQTLTSSKLTLPNEVFPTFI